MVRPHAFIAMPFGIKPGADGKPIDFNRVYREYLAPALEAAGLESFRADQEIRAGDIRTDMFQELLVADLVVADLSIDNPNVWYELGVRHALRARGVVIVSGGQTPTAFDLYTDRKLRYGLKDGGPDPATIEDDKRKLTDMVKATMKSWHGRKVSPVYNLMPNLQEPDWQSLRIGDVREFWEQHDAWDNRLGLARKAGRIGDVLVLAEEAPVAAFRANAWIKAGEALRKAERFRFALERLDRGLEIEPENLCALQGKGMCLQRLALAGVQGYSLERAREHYRAALKLYPTDPETWALLGRVDKDAWVAAWRQPGRLRSRCAKTRHMRMRCCVRRLTVHRRAYSANPGHYYSGINALTLMHLARYTTNDTHYERDTATMAGAVRYAAECEPDQNQLFWSKTTLGGLRGARRHFRNREGRLQGSDCEKREGLVRAKLISRATAAPPGSRLSPGDRLASDCHFDRALGRLVKPEDRWEPRQVLFFSGHMVDAADRKTPRFPAGKEAAAAQAIEGVLDRLGAGPEDLAFCQAAAGGDLLFLEACQRRGVRCKSCCPLPSPSSSKNRSFLGWRRKVARSLLRDEGEAAGAGTDPYYARLSGSVACERGSL